MKWFGCIQRQLSLAFFGLAVAGLPATTSRAHEDDGPGTLAYELATNAVWRAQGYKGTLDDMMPLANWHYDAYTSTNLDRITNSSWSTNFWLHGMRGLSATCIGIVNGMGGQGLVTMVSPRHYLCSTHMHPEGSSLAFLDTNNVVYWRKTLERVDVTNDISVGLLNVDLPSAVGYLPVAPADIGDYLPPHDIHNLVWVQGLGMNQDMRIFSQPMHFGYGESVFWNVSAHATNGLPVNWNIQIRSGDSSAPGRLLIGDQLVLVSHASAVNGGPSYFLKMPAINAKMRELSKHNHVKSDYQLTTFSLDARHKVH